MATLAEQLAKRGLVDKTEAAKASKQAEERWVETGGPPPEVQYKPEVGKERDITPTKPAVQINQPLPSRTLPSCDPPPAVDCTEQQLRDWERANAGRSGYYETRQEFLSRQVEAQNAREEAKRQARETAEREAIEKLVAKYVVAMEGGEIFAEVYPVSSILEQAVMKVGAVKAIRYMIRLAGDRDWSERVSTANALASVLVGDKFVPSVEEMEQLSDEELHQVRWPNGPLASWAKSELIRRHLPELGFITPLFGWVILTQEGEWKDNLFCHHPNWVHHGQPVSTTPGPQGWWDGNRFHEGSKFDSLVAVAGSRAAGLYLHLLKGAGSFEGTQCWGRHPDQGYPRFFWRSRHGGPHITVGADNRLAAQIDRLVEACKGDMKLPADSYWVAGELRGRQLVAANQPKGKGAIVLVKGTWVRSHMQQRGQEYALFEPIQGSEKGGARVLAHTEGSTTGGGHRWTYTVVYLPPGGSLRFKADFWSKDEVREVSFDFTTLEPTWKKV